AVGDDDVRSERGQLRRMFACVVGIARRPADVDAHVAADAPARFLQPLQECCETGLPFRIARGLAREHADAPHPLGLRARRNRPCGCRRAAEQRYELAAPRVGHASFLPVRVPNPSTSQMAQAAAALRDFGPAYERYGCFRVGTAAGQSPPISAVAPTAAIGEKPTPRSRAAAGP